MQVFAAPFSCGTSGSTQVSGIKVRHGKGHLQVAAPQKKTNPVMFDSGVLVTCRYSADPVSSIEAAIFRSSLEERERVECTLLCGDNCMSQR